MINVNMPRVMYGYDAKIIILFKNKSTKQT